MGLYFTSKSWKDFPSVLKEELSKLSSGSIVVEIGGGANPCITKELIKDYQLEYYVVDVDQEELDKREDDHYKRICADITEDDINVKADLIITKMLLEHIPNPEKFHKACFSILKDGGKALHFYATLYSMASIANLLLPEWLSNKIIFALQKNRDKDTDGKFPAYYKWSYGPTTRQQKRFEGIGFQVELFHGYLGQNYFVGKPILRQLERFWNFFLMKTKSPYLCSNAIVTLIKE